MPTPIQVVKKVVETARRWARFRARYRKLLDSKSANPKDVEKTKKKLLEATNQLEVSVLEFEAYQKSIAAAIRGPKKAFPWKEILGGISVGTGLLEKAMQSSQSGQRPPRVIDVKAEVVDPK